MPDQNYANHRQRAPLWLAGAALSVFAFCIMALAATRQPGWFTMGLLSMAAALMCAVVMARSYALRVQNRIIRLEMQVRLATLGRTADLAKLEMPQIIALRF